MRLTHNAFDPLQGNSRWRITCSGRRYVRVPGRTGTVPRRRGPREDADVVLTHLAADMRENLVPVVEFDTEHRVLQGLDNATLDLDCAFFSHTLRFPGTVQNCWCLTYLSQLLVVRWGFPRTPPIHSSHLPAEKQNPPRPRFGRGLGGGAQLRFRLRRRGPGRRCAGC